MRMTMSAASTMSPIAHQGIPRRTRAGRPAGAFAHASQKFPVLRRTRHSLHSGLPHFEQYPSAGRSG